MTTTMTAAFRVAAGVRVLDEKVPGWRDRINVDELEMRDAEFCVVGQVFGDFGRGIALLSGLDANFENLAGRADWVVSHGFDEYRRKEWVFVVPDYAELQVAWVAELAPVRELVAA